MYYYFMAVALGVIMAVYLPILSQSGRIIASPILANIPFFAIALLTSIVAALAMGNNFSDFVRLRDIPAWMFLAGVISGLMILGTTFLLPKIGPGPFFVLFVAGQIFTGSILSHYGLLGATLDIITLRRIFGLILVVTGAWFVSIR